MGDVSYSGRYTRSTRSRSRSPFRKNFNERPVSRERIMRRRDTSRDKLPGNRVFVGNIPFKCTWMELKDLFREKVEEVSFVELFEDNKGKFSGSGVVEFKDAQTAQKAINIMHKYEFKGRLLNVKEDIDRDRRRSMERDRSDIRYGDRDDFASGPGYDTYGLNPDFLRSLNIEGPLTTKIFISNLDYKVTEKKLEEIFKLSGKLTKMDLNMDNDGKSKGHAIGEYENPLEAVQAISMFNGQKLYSRIMNVRMDKFADEEPASKLPSGLHGIGKGLGAGGLPMQFTKSSGSANGSGFNLGSRSSGSIGMGSSSMVGMMPSERSLMSSSSSIGMGASSTSIGSLGNVGRSLDSVSREPFPISPYSPPARTYRDFDRDSFSSDTVMLGNLPSGFTWQLLKDRFRDLGEVRCAEMKGQGMALLRFAAVSDARRAADMMHNTRFDGRLIQARLY